MEWKTEQHEKILNQFNQTFDKNRHALIYVSSRYCKKTYIRFYFLQATALPWYNMFQFLSDKEHKHVTHIERLYSSSCSRWCRSSLGGSWQTAGVMNSIRYSHLLGSEVDVTVVSFPQINLTWNAHSDLLHVPCWKEKTQERAEDWWAECAGWPWWTCWGPASIPFHVHTSSPSRCRLQDQPIYPMFCRTKSKNWLNDAT